MLRQSAQRRAVQRYLRRSQQQLYLPWLCPSLHYRSQQPSRQTQSLSRPPTSTRVVASSPSSPLSRKPQSRELASAANESFPYPADDQYVPFNATAYSSSPYEIPQLYDPTKLLMLEELMPAEGLRLKRGAASEIGGTASELLATFQACLHVGRFERAGALLSQRLAHFYIPGSEELSVMNHQYIRNLLQGIELSRKQEDYSRLTEWIEKGMSKIGAKKDGVAYAALLKGALVMLDGAEKEDKVRECWKAVEDGHYEANVIGAATLSEDDLGLLSEICPSEMQKFAENYEADQGTDQLPAGELDAEIDINPSAEVATAALKDSSPVRSVAQRGLGLKYLQQSMHPLTEGADFEAKPWLTAEENQAEFLRQRQEQLETTAIEAALRRWREERSSAEHTYELPKMGPFLWEWQSRLAEKIEEELKLVEAAEKRSRKSAADQARLEYGPFLRLVSPDKLAGVTIVTFLTLMSKSGAGGDMKLSNMIVNVGRAVHMEAIVSSLAESSRRKTDQGDQSRKFTKYVEAVVKNEGGTALWKIRRRLREEDSSMDVSAPLSATHWSNVTYAKVGGILAQLFVDLAKVKVSVQDPDTDETIHALQPAFHRTYRYDMGKKVAFLTMHMKIEERLRKDPAPAFIVKHLPMLSPPKPWRGFLEGGYFKTNVPVIRVKNAVDRQRRYVEVAASKGDLDSFFAGLDVLGRTRWKINHDVYDVMLEAWNSGQAVANLAPAEYDVPPPSKPSNMTDLNIRKKYYTEVRRWENEKTGLHSERCFQNLQMEMAQNYVNEEFYLPHNADFRGRAYPLAPYLNQMGADNARGLLLFGEGRVLGTEGLRWLKIHLANVFGYDKASLSEREQFAMDHLEEIRDSTENPLTGKKWWLEAEDPWQCLATCFELQHAFDSQDPEQYVSHLPVHQDGSCNGLQHYAALGGDKAGAQQVNLEPSDRPSDVYTGVAELIKAEIAKEAAEGSKIARLLDGKIKRKIVKQTVMTNVYGVTFLGATRQVRKQLEAHFPELMAGSVPISGICAAYVARKIFNALGSIFSGAHNIQFWLGDCASRISASLTPEQVHLLCEKAEDSEVQQDSKKLKSLKKTPEKHFSSGVTWTTPLNLTVVQPYRQSETTLVTTAFQQVSIRDPQANDTIDKRRQLQAFPPNFVHSLDATHMILSALRCDAAGLSFSAVHDSFWTHAASVNEMNTLLRDAFVQMHSEDVIGRLATEFKLRYSRHLFRATVRPGANPLRKQLEAWRRQYKKENHIHSSADLSLAELKLEVRRQELLRSENPKERKAGKEMITPGSLFDECDGEQFLQTQKSLGETALGHVPDTAPEDVIREALNPVTTDPMTDVDMEASIGPMMDEHSLSSPHVKPIFDEPPQEQYNGVVNVPQQLSLRDEILADLSIPKDREMTEDETNLVEMMEEARAHLKAKEEKKKNRVAGRQYATYIWLPLRFAEVPKRGEWDVRRLKESDYFFS